MDNLQIQIVEDDPLHIRLGRADDYNALINRPIHINTAAYWNSDRERIGEYGHLYIYTDYETVDGQPVPAMKVGDGLAYLIDAPFLDGNASALLEHIRDQTVHITPAEREFWNNKASCYLDDEDTETVIFTKF